MKRLLILTLAFAFIMGLAVSVQAYDLAKPIDKLSKGTVEVVKSPLVLYDHTKSEMDSHDNKIVGLFKGLLESPFHVVKKAGSGALDIATFPVE